MVNDREILGTVYLRAEYELWDRLIGYLGIAAIVALAAMLVAYALSTWLQRVVTRPLLAIAAVAREVTEKRNFALRAEKLSEDEIGRLVDAFNAMLGEIGRATQELEATGREAAREMAERRRAEEEVLRLNAELEQRVQGAHRAARDHQRGAGGVLLLGVARPARAAARDRRLQPGAGRGLRQQRARRGAALSLAASAPRPSAWGS